MSSRPHFRALLVALSLATVSGQALARPSLWQRARDPALEQAAALTEVLERLLAFQAEIDGPSFRDVPQAAVVMADLAGAERLPGARLHCLLGRALLEAGSWRRAESVLERAVSEGPQGSFAATCLLDYAVTLARTGKPEPEVRALTRALEFAFDPSARAQIYCNRGEGFMALGQLGDALADFRRGVALARSPDTQALCQYDLGVGLDRNGDLPAAWKALDVARAIRLPLSFYEAEDALDLPGVFFVPDYEVHYYRALSSMSAARRESDDEERRQAYELALTQWEAYVGAAKPAGDRFVTQAELHAAACRSELKKIKPRRPAAPEALDFAEPPPD